MKSIAEILPSVMHAFSQRLYRPGYRSARTTVGQDAQGLPFHPVICPWCFGAGGADCVCRGVVLVCPTCRGARHVRRESEDGSFVPPVPCPDCTDWYRRSPTERYEKTGSYRVYAFAIDRHAETLAIARYLADHPEVFGILSALGVSVDEWTG